MSLDEWMDACIGHALFRYPATFWCYQPPTSALSHLYFQQLIRPTLHTLHFHSPRNKTPHKLPLTPILKKQLHPRTRAPKLEHAAPRRPNPQLARLPPLPRPTNRLLPNNPHNRRHQPAAAKHRRHPAPLLALHRIAPLLRRARRLAVCEHACVVARVGAGRPRWGAPRVCGAGRGGVVGGLGECHCCCCD